MTVEGSSRIAAMACDADGEAICVRFPDGVEWRDESLPVLDPGAPAVFSDRRPPCREQVLRSAGGASRWGRAEKTEMVEAAGIEPASTDALAESLQA